MNTPKLIKSGWILLVCLTVTMSALAFSQPELDSKAIDAVLTSDVAELAVWCANGGDVNDATAEGNTLLMMAAKIGDRPTIEFLLSQSPEINAQNAVGTTALMIAAKYGHQYVVKMLLDESADPAIINKRGFSAARFAWAYDHPKVYKQLRTAEFYSKGQTS